MEDLCRICRKNCSYESILIHSSHDGVLIADMLIKTCPIDIISDDPISRLLPQSICNDCLEVILAAFNLQRVCIESDLYYRTLVTSEEIVVKNEKFEDEPAIMEEKMDVYDDQLVFKEEKMDILKGINEVPSFEKFFVQELEKIPISASPAKIKIEKDQIVKTEKKKKRSANDVNR